MIYESYDITEASKRVKKCHVNKYFPLLEKIIANDTTLKYDHILHLIRAMFFNNRLKLLYIKKVIITLLAYVRQENKYIIDKDLCINWRSIHSLLAAHVKHAKMIEEHQSYLNQMAKNKNMVFDNKQRETLLNFCKNELSHIDINANDVDVKKRIDFSTLILLLFASGARFINIYSLTINLYEQFITQGSIEMITKTNKVTEIYLPHEIQYSHYVQPILLYHEKHGTGNKSDLIFTTPQYRLSRFFDSVYLNLFDTPRPKQLRWHAARRWWSGQIYKKFGMVATAKGMGHSSIFTTSRYVNQSFHTNDMKEVINLAITI